jgi:hypothetical protein
VLFSNKPAMATPSAFPILFGSGTTNLASFNEVIAVLRWRHRLCIQRVMISINGLRNAITRTARSLCMMDVAGCPRPTASHTTTTRLTPFLMPFIVFFFCAFTATPFTVAASTGRRFTATTTTTRLNLSTCHLYYSINRK